jgi:hypothetical protein
VGRTGSIGNLQKRAAGFYGLSGTDNNPVGEVRYIVGWHADQMTRLDWDVLIDGSDQWSVTVGEGDDAVTVSTKQADGEQDVTAASKELLTLIDWDDTNIRAVDTNLFVVGQGDYAELDNGWRVVSPLEPQRKEILKGKTSVPFLWPNPFDPTKPDAPLFSVIELLEQLDWMNRQARTQSRQRVLTSGFLVTSDAFRGPNGETFWTMHNEAQRAKMVDPDDLSPINLTGPGDAVKDGVNWIIPDYGYDAVIDKRMVAAIDRLAYGLPIPPEILLGLQAQSRATAFQVEENAYRAHIEPPALLVAQVAQDALSLLVKDVALTVVPNPSRLLARRNSVQDVKDAWDRGLVTPEYVREVLGIPEDAAPEPDRDGIPPAAGTGAAPTDPANDAAAEGSPINASGQPELSTLLADIDTALSSELAGVTVMATDRARQRLGAAARVNPRIRDNPDLKKLGNADLAVTLGQKGLETLGVSVADQIAEPVDSAARWWVRRVSEIWEQVGQLIPGWKGQGDWVEESVTVLADALVSHIIDSLSQELPPPLDAGGIRKVVDAAAGDR